jgi:hypothetical protein
LISPLAVNDCCSDLFMLLAAFRTWCARDPQHADEKTLGARKKNKRYATEECG